MSKAVSSTVERFVIFGLFGPPLGLVTGLGVLSLIGPASAMPGLGMFALLVPATYLLTYFLGLLPALVTALIDSTLARRATPRRILWTTLAGTTASIPPIAAVIGLSGVTGRLALAWLLTGAVPAAICSSLAGRLVRS
jgi:hypothetical protein